MVERRVSANIYQIYQFSERYCIGGAGLTLVWCWRDVDQAGIETAKCEQAIIKTVFS
jgi:hypothetical protein